MKERRTFQVAKLELAKYLDANGYLDTGKQNLALKIMSDDTQEGSKTGRNWIDKVTVSGASSIANRIMHPALTSLTAEIIGVAPEKSDISIIQWKEMGCSDTSELAWEAWCPVIQPAKPKATAKPAGGAQ